MVRSMDKAYLVESLLGINGKYLKLLRYIRYVDEIPEIMGHGYITVIYDMKERHLTGIETRKSSDILSTFLNKSSSNVAKKIQTKEADIVFS